MLKISNEVTAVEATLDNAEVQLETLTLEQLEVVGGGAETVNYG